MNPSLPPTVGPDVLRACRRLAALELPIVIAIAPALLFPTPTRLLALAVIPCVWACIRATGAPLLPRTPFDAALWWLLAMVGISTWATFDLRFSLGKVAGMVLAVLLFWAAVRQLTTRGRLTVGVALFLVAGGGLALVGLLGTNWEVKIPLIARLTGRLPQLIRGVPGAAEGFSPNAVAGCLVLFIPLQLAMLGAGDQLWAVLKLSGRGRLRAAQAVLLAATSGTLLMTQSRGAFGGLAVAFGVFLLWHSRRTRALAMAGLAGLAVLALRLGPQRLIDVVVSQPYAGYSGVASQITNRAELWSRAIWMIQDFPFAGVGMNGFRKAMPLLYPPFLSPPDADVAHSHNLFLQAALDLGLPGLIAYAAIWWLAATLLIQVYRRSRDPVWRAVAGGLGAGLIAHFMFSMTDLIPLGSKVGSLFWLALALTVGLHRVALGNRPEVGVS